MDKLCFLAGLPRSGSTVLASILNQHNEVYVSPTSELVGLLFYANNIFKSDNAKARPNRNVTRKNVLNGIIQNMYQDKTEPVIIDKNRAWPNPDNIRLLEDILEKPVKIICTIRSIKDVVASFIRLVHRNPVGSSFIDKELTKRNQDLNDINRIKYLIGEEGHVYQAWQQIKWNQESEFADRMFYVDYDELVDDGESVIERIENYIGINKFGYDFGNIENKECEDDGVYGLDGMHSVENVLGRKSGEAEEVLGEDACKFLDGFDIRRV